MKLPIYLTLLVMLFTACQKEDFLMQKGDFNATAQNVNPHRVTLKEALSTANDLFSQLEDGQTRSVRQVKNVKYLLNNTSNTRSETSADTLFYLVNYEGDTGFALLSADARMAPVLAISSEGTLDLEEINSDSGLALFMENVYTVESSIVLNDTTHYTLIGGGPIHIELPGAPTVNVYHNIKPMLKVNPRHWNQWYPYNKYCPPYNSQGSKSAVGCAPLACAQIMSYHQWPTYYAGFNLDWNYINGLSSDGKTICPDWLSHFLYEAGKTLHADFGHTSSGSTGVSTKDIKNYFYKFGYKQLSDPVTLKRSGTPEALQKSPLLVVAKGVGNAGHAWVIDGYLSYSITGGMVGNPEQAVSYSMYHCVWGWGGCNNGYFLWRDGSEVSADVPYYDDEDKNDNPYSAKFTEVKYFKDITPLK